MLISSTLRQIQGLSRTFTIVYPFGVLRTDNLSELITKEEIEDIKKGSLVNIRSFHAPFYLIAYGEGVLRTIDAWYFDITSKRLLEHMVWYRKSRGEDRLERLRLKKYSKLLSWFKFRDFKTNPCSYCLLDGYCKKEGNCKILVPKFSCKEFDVNLHLFVRILVGILSVLEFPIRYLFSRCLKCSIPL